MKHSSAPRPRGDATTPRPPRPAATTGGEPSPQTPPSPTVGTPFTGGHSPPGHGEWLRQLMEDAGDAIFVIDPATERLVDANQTACRWLGRSRDDLVRLMSHDLPVGFPLTGSTEDADHVADTRGAARPRIFGECVHWRRNGTSFPVEVTIVSRALMGRNYRLVIARDISARKRAEGILHESEDRFRRLFDLSHDAIYLTERNGVVVEMNRAAQAFFGYAPGEWRGISAGDLYARPLDIRTFQRRVQTDGLVHDLDVLLRTTDDTPIPGLLSATYRQGADGEVAGYLCIVRGVPPDVPDPATLGVADPQPGNPDVDPPDKHREAPEPAEVADPPPAVDEQRPSTPEPSADRFDRASPTTQEQRGAGTSSEVVVETVLIAPPEPDPPGVEDPRVIVEAAARRGGRRHRVGRPRPIGGRALVPLERPFWGTVAGLGAALTILGWSALARLWYPLDLASPAWAVGTIRAHLDGMPLGTVGLATLALGTVNIGWRRGARCLACASVAIALMVFVAAVASAVYAAYLAGVPIALRGPAAPFDLEQAVTRIALLGTAYVVVYGWLGRVLWKGARGG